MAAGGIWIGSARERCGGRSVLTTAWKTAAMTLPDRYIGMVAARAYVLVAAGLAAMFTFLAFVEQLALVGQGNYHPADALIYVALTAPNRLIQVTPVAMLLGSLVALGGLNRHSELTAFRSLGISEARIIGSVMQIAVPVCLAMFLVAEFIVPPVQRLAQDMQSSALEPTHEEQSFWATGNGQYLNIQRFGRKDVLHDVDIFSFDKDGNLTRYLHGDRADIEPNGSWLLTGVVQKQVEAAIFHTEDLTSLVWQPFITLSQLQLLRLPIDTMPPVELDRYLRHLKRQALPAGQYEQELWARIAFPLSIVAMIMVAAPLVFGKVRARNGYQIVVGAAIGIVFSLSEQITRHIGALLDLSPAATALIPPMLLATLAIYLFRRTV
jgi:lipopolysaccharide export system permease protein